MRAVTIIRLLLEATQRGKIRWHRSKQNPDVYESDLDGEPLSVRFVRFVRADQMPSDRYVAEVECFGVTTDHAVGTEGMDLVNQMLAFNDLEWTQTRAAIRERLMEAEAALNQLLEPTPAVLPSKKARLSPVPRVRVRR